MHVVGELPCGFQPTAPTCVVWSWQLKDSPRQQRVKWAEEGETSSHFFLRMGKKRGAEKWISALRVSNVVVTGFETICESWASFYIDLFTACLDDLEVQSELLNCLSLCLSIDDAASCDGPISSSRLMQLSLSWLRARLRAPMACQWSFMLFSGIWLVGILWTFLILLWRLASSLFLIVSHSLP